MTPAKRKSPVGGYILAAAAVIALDQALKAWIRTAIPLDPAPAEQISLIPGLVHLSHIHNAGVAFGLLQGGRWAFLALLAVFCALVIWALRTDRLAAPWERWTAVLAMAGALSNGIDRAVCGYVVDMLELEFIRFPVFNLADSVINVSCVLFVALTLFKKEPKETAGGAE
ncbi:MAG: signal peptidase II [Oscillospiraceae bacterium]|nr:signal peptidase II [Oscillospiraceae bacterium]